MKFSIATITLESLSPYSQSRQHDEPFLEGESHDAHDQRTWRSKLNTETRDGKLVVVFPAHGIQQCFSSGARYSKKKIPGAGKSTWTAKFEAGITVPENPILLGPDGKPIDPAKITSVTIPSNPQGKRGGEGRVPRRFPVIPVWKSVFDIWILDHVITKAVFADVGEISGMFVGLGRFRPQNGGTNGRFKLTGLEWEDNRSPVGLHLGDDVAEDEDEETNGNGNVKEAAE